MSSVNVNIGVLGHVDSGKTSLVRALSTQLSTASLDKHPESQKRGITLDLGFSSFHVSAPPHFLERGFDDVQFTLVDCPGHASLVRTVIGGAQIIDMMVLVVDVQKGIQAQTAECLVIGDILCNTLVVALNKIDLLPETERAARVEEATARLRAALRSTRFGDCPIVPIAASIGGGGVRRDDAGGESRDAVAGHFTTTGLEGLVETLATSAPVPDRDASAPFLFVFDHCFAIKGKGTVLTGTVLAGAVEPGDEVEFPALRLRHRVKSLQVFRRPVSRAAQGDRVAMLVPGLPARDVERGVAARPGSVREAGAVVAAVRRVRFHKSDIPSGARLHVTVGHTTVMATATFFGHPILPRDVAPTALGLGADARAVRGGAGDAGAGAGAGAGEGAGAGAGAAGEQGGRTSLSAGDEARFPAVPFTRDADYPLLDELVVGLGGGTKGGATKSGAAKSGSGGGGGEQGKGKGRFAMRWALLKFDSPVLCTRDSLLIASRLDADATAGHCRIAFHGRVSDTLPAADAASLSWLRVYRPKQRRGTVDRVVDARTLICKGMFGKETDLAPFLNLSVSTPDGAVGRIEAGFGKSGKVRVVFPTAHGALPGDAVSLDFLRLAFDPEKRMVQR